MTRFIYLSDTHLGALGLGYHHRKPFPERLPEIVAALSKWMERDGSIDFVLHGGDLVDAGTPSLIQQACEAFKLPAPTYLCLGNHDLTHRESLATWLESDSVFFPTGTPEFRIETDDCAIHVVPNQWGDIPYYWSGEPRPTRTFLPGQMAFFEQSCCEAGDKMQILLTHTPVWGPPDHQPDAAFREVISGMVADHPAIRQVLGAHSHVSSLTERLGVQYRTSPALIEDPFEFSLFEIERDTVRVETISYNCYIAQRK